MHVDDYFDADYERGIEESPYLKARYGYLEGEYVAPPVREPVRRAPEAVKAAAYGKYGECVDFDSDVLKRVIAESGISKRNLSIAAGLSSHYVNNTLPKGRATLDRLKALCAVLKIDVSELTL